VIVVDKPSGLVVHPAAGHHNDTLVNALIHLTNSLSSGFEANRPGLVHRLDKDTSGILVVAKNDFSHRKLALQFKAKSVERIYWAVVNGQLSNRTGRFESYLRRNPANRMKFMSDTPAPGEEPSGKLAITDYKVLAESKDQFSLVQLQLQTGRTHQIRIHLSEAGNFVLGDPIYGPKQPAKNLKNAERLMLHARSLGFIHPRNEKFLQFESDGLDFGFNPKDFGLSYVIKT
jgi:23S rRNA pseudouridine1911/1915/1917 synthase